MFLLDFACTRFTVNVEKCLDITAFSLSPLIGNICTGSISPLTGPREMKDGFLVLQGEKPLEIGEVHLWGNEVILHVPSLSEEKCAVSFAQVPYIRVRIYNSADLPMKPFYCEL